MLGLEHTAVQNRLLRSLPAAEFELLAPHLSRLELVRGAIISEAGEPIADIVFPEAGLISIVVCSPEGSFAEGGLIGREGFATPSVLLGTDRVPQRFEVQIAGRANVIRTSAFLEAVAQNEGLRLKMLRFMQCLMVQATFTALSNAIHPVEERLARWLLMCHDRSESDDIALTHRFLSVMLAVRRASVTTALQTLEGSGFISTERGYICIEKRAALEEFAGDAYGQSEAEYTRLLGRF